MDRFVCDVSDLEVTMIIIVLGLITTLLGVAFGCTVLEFTVRAVGYSLTAQDPKGFLRNKSRFTMSRR